jgi:hypothetical protein
MIKSSMDDLTLTADRVIATTSREALIHGLIMRALAKARTANVVPESE